MKKIITNHKATKLHLRFCVPEPLVFAFPPQTPSRGKWSDAGVLIKSDPSKHTLPSPHKPYEPSPGLHPFCSLASFLSIRPPRFLGSGRTSSGPSCWNRRDAIPPTLLLLESPLDLVAARLAPRCPEVSTPVSFLFFLGLCVFILPKMAAPLPMLPRPCSALLPSVTPPTTEYGPRSICLCCSLFAFPTRM